MQKINYIKVMEDFEQRMSQIKTAIANKSDEEIITLLVSSLSANGSEYYDHLDIIVINKDYIKFMFNSKMYFITYDIDDILHLWKYFGNDSYEHLDWFRGACIAKEAHYNFQIGKISIDDFTEEIYNLIYPFIRNYM